MILGIFLIIASIVNGFTFWCYFRNKDRSTQNHQTDFFEQLEGDQAPPWANDHDDQANS